MSLLSNVCRLPENPLDFQSNLMANIDEAAGNLACLLIDTAEFQNYARLARAVNLDPKVSELNERLHSLQISYFMTTDNEGNTVQDLTDAIEALPIMREYRQAERAVHELFRAVDRIISQEAGAEFAANARSAFT